MWDVNVGATAFAVRALVGMHESLHDKAHTFVVTLRLDVGRSFKHPVLGLHVAHGHYLCLVMLQELSVCSS